MLLHDNTHKRMVILVSDNALLRIQAAEAEAEKIISDARIKANEIITEAQKKGIADYESKIAECEAKAKADEKEITEKAMELAERVSKEAKEESDSWVAGTVPALKTAVKEIIWGITEQCR